MRLLLKALLLSLLLSTEASAQVVREVATQVPRWVVTPRGSDAASVVGIGQGFSLEQALLAAVTSLFDAGAGISAPGAGELMVSRQQFGGCLFELSVGRESSGDFRDRSARMLCGNGADTLRVEVMISETVDASALFVDQSVTRGTFKLADLFARWASQRIEVRRATVVDDGGTREYLEIVAPRALLPGATPARRSGAP